MPRDIVSWGYLVDADNAQEAVEKAVEKAVVEQARRRALPSPTTWRVAEVHSAAHRRYDAYVEVAGRVSYVHNTPRLTTSELPSTARDGSSVKAGVEPAWYEL